MADDASRKTYPTMPANAWWALRRQFARSIPGEVTPNYVATTLSIAENSARMNIIPALKAVGIINDAGVPQERARRWRDDDEYANVCKEIAEAVYPRELRDIAPSKPVDRDKVKRWFANRLGVGENAALKQSAFYSLLVEGELSKESGAAGTGAGTAKKITKSKSTKPSKAPPMVHKSPEGNGQDPTTSELGASTPPKSRARPELHVNVQIHLSPEATAEQIDQLFQSMAKHLKDL